VTVRYLPYDLRGPCAAFCDRRNPAWASSWKPKLWPHLVQESQRAGVKLFLVNARLSERSARGYRKLAALARETLAGFEAVAAQTQRMQRACWNWARAPSR